MPKLSEKQMTVGDLVTALRRKDYDLKVVYDFGCFTPTTLDSYRGFYEDLALGYEEYGDITVEQLLERLEKACGKVFTGYKGGDFDMDSGTALWVSNYREFSPTVICDVTELDGSVVLRTDRIAY